MRQFNFLAAGLSVALLVSSAGATTVETYDQGTDIGQWSLTTNPSKPRIFQTTGGNPNGFLEQDDVAGGKPEWATASPRYQPGFNDTYKIDSDFTGNFAAVGVTGFSIDVNVLHPGNWATDRAPTIRIDRWDDVNQTILVEATFTGADLPDDTPPAGWNTYAFNIPATSTTIPAGWDVERGDGATATDADWVTLMQRVDLTSFGFWKPGFFYSSLGSWSEGIDNVTITTTPEPATLGLLGLGLVGLVRRRSR